MKKRVGILLLVIILIFTGICTVGCIERKIPQITAGGIEGWAGERVAIEITPIKKISGSTEFEFFILMPSCVGKTVGLIRTSIYVDYDVYRTTEGVMAAFEKYGEISLGKRLLVEGRVEEDEGKCVILVDKIYKN